VNYCGMPSIAKLRGVMVGVFRPGMPAVCAAQWMVEEPRIMLGCSVTTRGPEGCSWERTISPPSSKLPRHRKGHRDRDHSIYERIEI
jgi:hypothetical protein